MINENIKIDSNELTIHADKLNVIEPPKYKNKIVLEGMTIYLEHSFNWFNRLMLRLIFGLNIEKVKDDRNA